MAKAKGSEVLVDVAFESTYGTAPSSGFFRVPIVSTGIGEQQDLLEDDTLGSGRDPLEPSLDVPVNEGPLVVPLDLRNSGTWLKGFLGAATTTGGSAPYTHTFLSAKTQANIPSLSMQIGNPDVSGTKKFFLNKGIRLNGFSIGLEPSGNASMTMDVIAQAETSHETTQSGTPTTLAFKRFAQFNGAVKLDDVALANVRSASINYSNNAEADRTIGNNGRINDADFGKASFTGTIEATFQDDALLAKAEANESVELIFEYVIDADNLLRFTAHSCKISRPEKNIDGPGVIVLPFDFTANHDDTAGQMLTVELINDVATY